MKIAFYVITNQGKAYLCASSYGNSWNTVKEPLEADTFPGIEEAEYYIEKVLTSSWRDALFKGSYSLAYIIEEL